MSKRRSIATLPEDCPAWLAKWIGGMNEWQEGVDNKLDRILRNGAKNVSNVNPGNVTWKELAGKILIPLLLALNGILLKLIFDRITGGVP